MPPILDIMMPLYLLVGLGLFFRLKAFPSATFWSEVEQLTYYVLFPALIFSSLSRAEISFEVVKLIVLIIAIPTIAIGALQGIGLIGKRVSRATMSSMFQGAVRNNTTLALVIVALILPDNGIALMALTMTTMVIINNLASVWVLEHFGNRPNKPSLANSVKNILSNPLILASIGGLALNISPLTVPAPLLNAIHYLGTTGLPLALLAVGAGLRFKSSSGKTFAIGLSSLSKLVLLPCMVYFLCQNSDINADLAKVFILYAAMPTAMSAYVQASQMGGDKETMAQIITFQMLVAAISMPIVISLI